MRMSHSVTAFSAPTGCPRDDGTVNSNTGTVGGHLIQARDLHVEGGLRLGDIQPRD